jgi:hypothetical protein
MPPDVIERGFAEQLELTSDDVGLIDDVNATRASAGSSRS